MTSRKKNILITGCSSGSIGSALAIEFHKQQPDTHIVATARSLSHLSHLSYLGIQIEVLDITSSSSITSLREKISSLDILINNAGGPFLGTIPDASMEDWRGSFDLNFFSVVEMTQAFLPLLIASKGIIVNHSSQNAYFGIPGTAMYACAKRAVSQYSDGLRNEMYPFGVRVVELVSGVVGSNLFKGENKTGIVVPEDSMFAPIRGKLEEYFGGEQVREKAMDPEVYAKRVVKDLLGSADPPLWIWRGFSASITYGLWWMGCHSKGSTDGMLRGMTGMKDLKAIVEKESVENK